MPSPARSARSRFSTRSILEGLVVVLVLGTIVGVAVLWPDGSRNENAIDSTGLTFDTEAGTVTAVADTECPQGFVIDRCAEVTFEAVRNPDAVYAQIRTLMQSNGFDLRCERLLQLRLPLRRLSQRRVHFSLALDGGLLRDLPPLPRLVGLLQRLVYRRLGARTLVCLCIGRLAQLTRPPHARGILALELPEIKSRVSSELTRAGMAGR